MGRFGHLEPCNYAVHRVAAQVVEVPAGSFRGVEIRLARGNAFLSYTFEERTPHRLLRFQRDDGTEYRLAKGERIAYWTMHDPGGEAWLPERVR